MIDVNDCCACLMREDVAVLQHALVSRTLFFSAGKALEKFFQEKTVIHLFCNEKFIPLHSPAFVTEFSRQLSSFSPPGRNAFLPSAMQSNNNFPSSQN